jgi:hypothetical protein
MIGLQASFSLANATLGEYIGWRCHYGTTYRPTEFSNSDAHKMRVRHLHLQTLWSDINRNRIVSPFIVLVFLSTVGHLVDIASAKTQTDSPSQEKGRKAPALRWDPPQVEARVPSISAVPPCSLPDVLKQAGLRAQELVDHLQKFIAYEQIRFDQTERPGLAGASTITGLSQIGSEQTNLSMVANFDYVVDFGERSEPLNIQEYRTRRGETGDGRLGAILDKGLPVLALIFTPALQSDYEMRCEGLAQWNGQPAWVVHFRQMKGKRPRTLTMLTPTEVHPRGSGATEVLPLSLKGRAWIAAESGQVMHIETNLVEEVLMIDLQEIAISVDYAAVASQSQNREIWLPQFAVAYTDYAKRRMIIEHTFSNFQIFSVHTQETTLPKDDTTNLGAKKQLGELNASSNLHSNEQLITESGVRKPAVTTTNPASSPRDSHWVPPDVDENVPPVESGSTCNLQEVLQKAGARIQEFVASLDRFTATESLLQETINGSGEVSRTEQRKYDYLVSIQEIRPGILGVQEYLSSGSTPVNLPGGFTTKGLAALVLIFHPYYSENFAMVCEGLATLNGQRTWQVHFCQRADKPNKIRAYSTGVNGPSHPIALKGRAWFDADTYQVVRLEADSIGAHPDIQLTVDHTAIEYGPVHFSSRSVDMWLPQTAELYSDFRGKRIHQRESFSNYLLFAVDDKQKISSPKASP